MLIDCLLKFYDCLISNICNEIDARSGHASKDEVSIEKIIAISVSCGV